MEIVIRKVNDQDYNDIYSLYKDEGWNSFSLETIEKSYSGSTGLVLEVDDKIVGVIRAITDGFLTLFICELIVDKNYRRNGYGKTLIENMQLIYPDTRMELISDASEFYEKLGFKSVGDGMRKALQK